MTVDCLSSMLTGNQHVEQVLLFSPFPTPCSTLVSSRPPPSANTVAGIWKVYWLQFHFSSIQLVACGYMDDGATFW
jgi:hypothetical protein